MSDPITFFNRHTGGIETEQIYGEGAMRFVYETSLGKMALRALVRRAVFSKFFGWRMSRPSSKKRITPFIEKYGLDAGEFANDTAGFTSFNDFFSRELKPGARPIFPENDTAVFPADGRHLGFQRASDAGAIYAKGQKFDLEKLLGHAGLAEKFRDGAIVCSRLCPTDYHRFHFPVGAKILENMRLNGWLYSVNPIALKKNIAYLWENKRHRVLLQTPDFGQVLLVVIGATNVGSIAWQRRANDTAAKGDELGFFRFGGSFVATIFEPEKIRLADDLLRETAAGRELYAKMGTPLGTRISA